jgi:predicted house-cleaning noncanonical NTP pyrophosphatase (MazG superfamily)
MKLKETETTEGAPVIKNSDEYWKEEFKKQRASRLQDSVDEYMQDGEVDAFFEDLRTAIQDLIDYHGKQKESAQTLMKVVSGHRPLQLQQEDDKYFQRKYNLAEADYYDKRAQLDMEHSKYYWDTERNKPDVKADGHSYQEIPERF